MTTAFNVFCKETLEKKSPEDNCSIGFMIGLFEKFHNSIDEKLAPLKEIPIIRNEVHNIQNDVGRMQNVLKPLVANTNKLVSQSFAHNFLVHGVAENVSESPESIRKVVIAIVNKVVSKNLTDSNIERVQRLRSIEDGKIRPIVVRLFNSSICENIISAFRAKAARDREECSDASAANSIRPQVTSHSCRHKMISVDDLLDDNDFKRRRIAVGNIEESPVRKIPFNRRLPNGKRQRNQDDNNNAATAASSRV